jgi:1-acyl-sn-glycerol-3-phosphate acyltransferase
MVLFTNHRSQLDSFFLGTALFWSIRLRLARLLPWNAPKRKWYTRIWPIAPFLRLVRYIPVHIDEKNRAHDMHAFHRILSVLRQGGVVHLFPEGTRERGDDILPIMPSACSLALLARSSVLIAYHRRSGQHRFIVAQRILSPEDVERIAHGGTLKERSRSLAAYVKWTFESLRRLSFATRNESPID